MAAAALLVACGPAADAPCGDASVCEPGATCFGAECDAEARCRHGLEARYHGRATAREGTCVATNDDDCRAASVTCGVWGQCSAPTVAPKGDCPARAAGDADFIASRVPGCAGRGTCVAVSDDDCRASRVCATSGRCAARDGVCVALSDVDCRTSTLCADVGYCTQTPDGRCRAGDGDDCLAAAVCRERAQCGERQGECVACERADTCQRAGLCTFEDGRCVRCDTSRGCRDDGLCTFAAGQCRATQRAHCERSRACREDGRCTLAETGTCVE